MVRGRKISRKKRKEKKECRWTRRQRQYKGTAISCMYVVGIEMRKCE